MSWLLGLDPRGDYAQWDKVMKIDLMILVGLALLHSKQHIFALTWVMRRFPGAAGRQGRSVHHPDRRQLTASGARRARFIEDNNEFALALVMTIPAAALPADAAAPVACSATR